jgi:hypothetical protein
MIGPGREELVVVPLGTVPLREAFDRCEAVAVRWSDGLGARSMQLPLLRR